MTLEEITFALKSAGAPPAGALQAGLAKADQLAPVIFALVDKLCEGIYLLPEESELLRNRLTILAAAKHARLAALDRWHSQVHFSGRYLKIYAFEKRRTPRIKIPGDTDQASV